MSLVMDGVALQKGDYIWHKDMGQWRVHAVAEKSVTVVNEFQVREKLTQQHVSGETRSYGWSKPFVMWKAKDDAKWDMFIVLVNQIRSLIYG